MSVKPIEWRKFAEFLRGFGQTDPEELLRAAQVSLWVRWFVLVFCFLEVNYRVEYGDLSHVLNNCYVLGFMAANGYVHCLVRRRGNAKPAWLLSNPPERGCAEGNAGQVHGAQPTRTPRRTWAGRPGGSR